MMHKYFIIAMMLVLGACATRPIHDVNNHPVPVAAQKLSLQEIEGEIVEAAVARGWLVDKKAPGHLTASYGKQAFEAVVDVKFTQASYSIVYNTSRNLLDAQGNIHHNYGRWVNNLDQDIQLRLVQAGRRKSF